MAKRRRGARTARPLPRHRPFDELVAVALDAIPEPFAERPRRGRDRHRRRAVARAAGARTRSATDETLYGLYEGVPRTEWGADWAPIPNRITLFRLPLEEDFADPDDLADEVWITVIHELAHHLGIDDARLHELGID